MHESVRSHVDNLRDGASRPGANHDQTSEHHHGRAQTSVWWVVM
jgi:hypothetical protein